MQQLFRAATGRGAPADEDPLASAPGRVQALLARSGDLAGATEKVKETSEDDLLAWLMAAQLMDASTGAAAKPQTK